MSQLAEKKKVFVGMSGGVDSSVSAALLKERGFDVTGIFIKVWSPEWLPCDWKAERRDAMRVAAHLGIPFITLDLEKEYKQGVADYMIEEYRRGRTPNPDVMCNKEVKFGSFLTYALEQGADFIATGHYAQVRKEGDAYQMLEGADKNKDQSYFLWTLGQEQLKHILFPVGHLEKLEVRKCAEKFRLPTAQKKDSQGVCFLGPLDMREFLGHYIESKRGEVLNEKNEAIGWHDGAAFFTLGERKGFTIMHTSPNDPPLYIIAKDIKRNTLTVSPEPGGIAGGFRVKEAVLENVNWISEMPQEESELLARFRYRQMPLSCSVKNDGGQSYVIFKESQTAVSPGQSLVLYRGEECLGGGIII